MREYRDDSGHLWRVWQVAPAGGTVVAVMPGELRTGWLCFERDGEKRRLAPVPPAWERRPDHELDLMRRAARPVARKE